MVWFPITGYELPNKTVSGEQGFIILCGKVFVFASRLSRYLMSTSACLKGIIIFLWPVVWSQCVGKIANHGPSKCLYLQKTATSFRNGSAQFSPTGSSYHPWRKFMPKLAFLSIPQAEVTCPIAERCMARLFNVTDCGSLMALKSKWRHSAKIVVTGCTYRRLSFLTTYGAASGKNR